MYKVLYNKYQIMRSSGKGRGNVIIGSGVVYTDMEIADIPTELDKYLAIKNQCAEITQIITIQGIVLASTKEEV